MTAGIARTDPMYISIPLQKRQRRLAEPTEGAVGQDESVPSQPAVEDQQSIVLNIQQQPDGTCIISLPDDFTGAAVVNIHLASSEDVSSKLNVDLSGWSDSDQHAPVGLLEADTEEETDDHNIDDLEENTDVLSPPSASRKRQRRSHTWQKNVCKTKRAKGEQYVSDTTHKLVKHAV